MCRFNVKHQPLKQTSTYEITSHRSTSALGSVNWFRLTVCAPTNNIAATPNRFPRFVNLNDGDAKMLEVSPTSGTFTNWGTTFRAAKKNSMLVVHLKFHVIPFVNLYRFWRDKNFAT
jgi:hypothetical protein